MSLLERTLLHESDRETEKLKKAHRIPDATKQTPGHGVAVGMRRYTDQQMLDELRRVAALLGEPLSRPKFMPHARISAPAISARFGGWLAAVEAAGLEPAYRYGGMWFDCPVCGTPFRSDNSPKSRRTCSRACASESQSRKRFKGDAATPQAARGRARRMGVLGPACERCGESRERLQVHHKDGNPYNNVPENFETLCSPCHMNHHFAVRGPLAPRPYCRSGQHEMNDANTFINKQGRRTCRACRRVKGRIHDQRRYAARLAARQAKRAKPGT